MSAFQENRKREHNSWGKVNTQIDANMIMMMDKNGGAIKPVESRIKSAMLSIGTKILKMKSFIQSVNKCF